MLDGEGVWTVVDGDPVEMRRGDLLLTAAMVLARAPQHRSGTDGVARRPRHPARVGPRRGRSSSSTPIEMSDRSTPRPRVHERAVGAPRPATGRPHGAARLAAEGLPVGAHRRRAARAARARGGGPCGRGRAGSCRGPVHEPEGRRRRGQHDPLGDAPPRSGGIDVPRAWRAVPRCGRCSAGPGPSSWAGSASTSRRATSSPCRPGVLTRGRPLRLGPVHVLRRPRDRTAPPRSSALTCLSTPIASAGSGTANGSCSTSSTASPTRTWPDRPGSRAGVEPTSSATWRGTPTRSATSSGGPEPANPHRCTRASRRTLGRHREDGPAGASRAAPGDLVDAVGHLVEDVQAMSVDAWDQEVLTARGRAVPASEVLWMRARETWIHGIDLDAGVAFAMHRRASFRPCCRTWQSPPASRPPIPPWRCGLSTSNGPGHSARASRSRSPARRRRCSARSADEAMARTCAPATRQADHPPHHPGCERSSTRTLSAA